MYNTCKLITKVWRKIHQTEELERVGVALMTSAFTLLVLQVDVFVF